VAPAWLATQAPYRLAAWPMRSRPEPRSQWWQSAAVKASPDPTVSATATLTPELRSSP